MQVVYPAPWASGKGGDLLTGPPKQGEGEVGPLQGSARTDATLLAMTAKERVLAEAPDWTEEQAERALRAAEDDGTEPQPPFSLIGFFRSGRGDLSERASRDEFEPQPFR